MSSMFYFTIVVVHCILYDLFLIGLSLSELTATESVPPERVEGGDFMISPSFALPGGTDSVAVNSLRESPMRKRSYKMQ